MGNRCLAVGLLRLNNKEDDVNKRITRIVILLMVLSAPRVGAEDGLGLGLILGEPTGISLKKWIGPTRAIDAAVAWSFSENASFQFHADYLLHNFTLLKDAAGSGRMAVYYGIGGRVKLKDRNNRGRGRNHNEELLGVRVPFGLTYLFAHAPVDLFAEIVPILNLVPNTDFDLNGAIGARFYLR